MSLAANPYAPPRTYVNDVVSAGSHADSIRQEHIKHEASIRSVGTLYYLSGALLLVVMVALMAGARGAIEGPFGVFGAVLLGVYGGMGALSIAVGHGLRSLRPWARTACIVVSIIGLLGIPLGTLINAYILYLMLSAKGKRIFEPDYLAIVEATPLIKYRTSVVVWVFVGLLLVLILGIIFAGVMSR